MRKLGRAVVALLVIALIGAYFIADLNRYFSLDSLHSQLAWLRSLYAQNPIETIVAYFFIYVLVTALSLPGAALMTLAGGALFGLLLGTVVVSFASTIGAMLAFLLARGLLRDFVYKRFGDKLKPVNAGIEKDGPFYLFALRLVPVFPFFVINLVMGLTTMRTWTFCWVSQVGMLIGTLAYVNAGTQLAQVTSMNDVVSPSLLTSLTVLGLLPLFSRKFVDALRQRRVYRRWRKPRRFDRNLVVIGAGAAGLVTAYIAAAAKAKVTLIEGHKMGGDCLNFGCVPSKALIRTAKVAHLARHAKRFGLRTAPVDVDFPEVMDRVKGIIRTIEPNDSAERYTALGVEVIHGQAKITSPWTVEVNGRTLSTRSIVIAAGARPVVPSIPGIESVGYYTSETIWSLRTLPRRLLVLGGGPIGCELAQAFARLGSEVTQLETDRLLRREDPDVSKFIEKALADDGVRLLTGHRAVRFETRDNAKVLVVKHDEIESTLEFDVLLCAVGRVPRTEGYGLEELGITLSEKATVQTDEYLKTIYPNIYACGDVAGPFQFTHTAAHQAWYAAMNGLFGNIKRLKTDYRVVPRCTFTDPEVAHVGLSESEARQQGTPYELTRFDLSELDRAITDGVTQGFVKVLTVPGKNRILGVTIVAEHAGDLITEYILAMRQGLGLGNVLRTIHPYPTLAEANKYVASAWQRKHVPAKLLRWLERYHRWRRDGRFARSETPT